MSLIRTFKNRIKLILPQTVGQCQWSDYFRILFVLSAILIPTERKKRPSETHAFTKRSVTPFAEVLQTLNCLSWKGNTSEVAHLLLDWMKLHFTDWSSSRVSHCQGTSPTSLPFVITPPPGRLPVLHNLRNSPRTRWVLQREGFWHPETISYG